MNTDRDRERRQRRRWLAAACVLVGVLIGPTPASALTDYTWSGATPASAANPTDWSNTTNWVNGSPPKGSVGTLTFPALTSAACTASPPTAACYQSNNNVGGTSATGLVIDGGAPYHITGDGLTLGSGGISATVPPNTQGIGARIDNPLALGAAQTWSINGNNTSVPDALSLFGGLTGSPNSLQLDLTNSGRVLFTQDTEVGPVSVVGASGAINGENSQQNGTLQLFGGLNGTNGNTVNFTDSALLVSSGATVGALSLTGGLITMPQILAPVGGPQPPPDILTVNGGLTVDAASAVNLTILQAGTTAGTDYSQIKATGGVQLDGSLSLMGPSSGQTSCPTLNQGDVDTLIATTGALAGTFTGIPDGQTIQLSCFGGSPDYVQINYTANSVTATVVPAPAPPPPPPANISPPTITGTPQVGQTLTEVHGTWTNNPTTYDYQWLDCDSSGANCMPVGAASQKYVLTSSDLGQTVVVAETACNAPGSCGQAISAPTAVVTPAPAAAPTPAPSPPPAPVGTAPSLSASAPMVTATAVDLSGTVSPNLLATTAHYEYGLSPSYRGGGPVVYDQRTPDQSLAADNASHTVAAQLTGLVPNAVYYVRLVATNSAGTTYGSPQTFTTLRDPAPPPPALGKSVVASVVSGLVFIKLPAGAPSLPATPLSGATGPGFAPLTEARALPVGTQIDARLGSLRLVTAAGHGGRTQTGVFGGALFSITQARSGLTTLTLLEGIFPGAPSYAACTAVSGHASPAARAAALSARTLQLLHSSVHGSFRTRGRYAAATVRGTVWNTEDRCNGTWIAVHRGTVLVRDFRRRVTVAVHAGHHYLAHAR